MRLTKLTRNRRSRTKSSRLEYGTLEPKKLLACMGTNADTNVVCMPKVASNGVGDWANVEGVLFFVSSGPDDLTTAELGLFRTNDIYDPLKSNLFSNGQSFELVFNESKDIDDPDVTNPYYFDPEITRMDSLVNVNGNLFFVADAYEDISNDDPNVTNPKELGERLWRSDGTIEGTVVVKRFDFNNVPENPDGTPNPELKPNEIVFKAPNHLTNVNGTLFFTARTLDHGYELWRTDGSGDPTTWNEWQASGEMGGTTLVKDIFQNDTVDQIGEGFADDVANLTNVNGKLFFTSSEVATRSGIDEQVARIWVSDGTSGGTEEVSEVQFYRFSEEGNFTNANGWLFFSAQEFDPENIIGTELPTLYRTDGVDLELVYEFSPGNQMLSGVPAHLTNVNGTLFFSAEGAFEGNTDIGRELWSSDGTSAGTRLVKDIAPGTGSMGIPKSGLDYNPQVISEPILANVNGTLFFLADDSGEMTNERVWKSDGTELGTLPVNGNYWNPNLVINANGVLFFTAKDSRKTQKVFRSNGFDTNAIDDTEVSDDGILGFHYQKLMEANGFVFAPTNVAELPSPEPEYSQFFAINRYNEMEVPAGEGVRDPGVLRVSTDGPFVDPRVSDDFVEMKPTSSLGDEDGGRHVRSVSVLIDHVITDPLNNDGITGIGSNLVHPFSIDEVNEPLTMEQVDLTIDNDDAVYNDDLLEARNYTNVEGSVYFIAKINPESIRGDLQAGTDYLWETSLFNDFNDGEFKFYKPKLVRDISESPIVSPNNLTNVDGRLIFVDSTKTQLMRVDRRPAIDDVGLDLPLRNSSGALLPGNFEFVASSLNEGFGNMLELINNVTNVEGTIYFSAKGVFEGIQIGNEVWNYADVRNNGTPNFIGFDVHDGRRSSTPRNLTNVNGDLFFSAFTGEVGLELWKIDHEGAPTDPLKDIRTGRGNSNPINLTNVGGYLYFSAYSNDAKWQLYRTDGSHDGTYMVKRLNPVNSSNPQHLTNVKGLLYFAGSDGGSSSELWVTDGREAITNDDPGTYKYEIRRENQFGVNFGSNPRNMTNVNGFLYFTAFDGTRDEGGDGKRNLYVLDGGEVSYDAHKYNNVRLPYLEFTNYDLTGKEGNFTNVNGTLMFTDLVLDERRDVVGERLYKAHGHNGFHRRLGDGTATGPSNLLQIIEEVSLDGGETGYTHLTNVSGHLHFTKFNANPWVIYDNPEDLNLPLVQRRDELAAAVERVVDDAFGEKFDRDKAYPGIDDAFSRFDNDAFDVAFENDLDLIFD